MALSPAEKQRRYRERQKSRETSASRVVDAYRAPFFERFDDFWLDFDLPLALAGISAPQFNDDSGPEAHVLNDATAGVEDPFNGATKSLGRAEVMIGCLLEAARALARAVNEHKLSEIERRLEEIEAADFANTAEKKAALADAARLTKMREDLRRQVRFTLPAWEASA